jgi:hypothetical protein
VEAAEGRIHYGWVWRGWAGSKHTKTLSPATASFGAGQAASFEEDLWLFFNLKHYLFKADLMEIIPILLFHVKGQYLEFQDPF